MVLTGSRVLSIQRVGKREKCTSGLRPATMETECSGLAMFEIVEGDGHGYSHRANYCESCLALRAASEPVFCGSVLVKTLQVLTQLQLLVG